MVSVAGLGTGLTVASGAVSPGWFWLSFAVLLGGGVWFEVTRRDRTTSSSAPASVVGASVVGGGFEAPHRAKLGE